MRVGAATTSITTLQRGSWRGSPWVDFAIKRSIGLLITIAVLVLATFFIVRLIPGDAATAAAGPEASLEQIAQLRIEMGLDQALPIQLWDYVTGLLRGDLGESFSSSGTVKEFVLARLPYTASLAVLAMTFSLLIAVPVGMAAGVLTRGGRHRWLDMLFGFGTGILSAIPAYVMATFLVVIFAVTLGLLPPAYSASQAGQSFVLPVLALSIGPICLISRVVRRETGVVLEQDFMRTARGWRLQKFKLYRKYALPSLMTSTLTLSGLVLTSMLGSAIIVETVFNWPGLGLGVVRAIATKDYPVVQGIVLVVGVLAALLTLLVDIILGLIDPRTLGGKND